MNIAETAENVVQLLWEEADALGRSSGFIQRQRKFSGSSYAQMLVLGALGEPELSFTHMTQYAALAGVHISGQGIAARFTAEGARFMAAVLACAVNRVAESQLSVAVPILGQFAGVYIRDSSVIGLPPSLGAIWPGVGNAAGAGAALKLQVRLNYSSGALDGPTLQPGRAHDRQSPYQLETEPAGSLSLADLGYFSLDETQSRIEKGQYVLLRYKQGTALYTEEGTRLDLAQWLRQLEQPRAELQVWVGQQHRLALRLLVERVPLEAAQQRRHRLREYERKKQTTAQTETRVLTEWTVILTNVPAIMLSFDAALVLLRVRWQVELLFKLWKSQLRADEWRSVNDWRILCELYAKLIVAVITQWIFQIQLWRQPNRSLFKAAQAVQKFAVSLALALRQHSVTLVQLTLQAISDCACCTAHISKRHQPPTFLALLACSPDEALS